MNQQHTLFEITSSAQQPITNRRKYSYKKAIKVLKKGGLIHFFENKKSYRFKLIDIDKNPVVYLHGTTFKALKKRGLIQKQADGTFAFVGAKN